MYKYPFNKPWSTHYSFAVRGIYDNWINFKLFLQNLIELYQYNSKLSKIEHPTVNAILERIHQVVTNTIMISSVDM